MAQRTESRSDGEVPRRPEDLRGRIVADRFRVDAWLGTGAMGEVYRAHDLLLRRDVALKRPLARSVDEVANRRRLLHEARRASTLIHPAIATIFDVLERDGIIVMQFVEGVKLSRHLGRPFDLPPFFVIAEDCAGALAAAAAKGVVHCDLKPDNIMLTPAGHPVILDFGLARTSRPQPSAGGTTESVEQPRGGTPAYMPPEVILGASPTPASDVFSFGIILYQLLLGRHPFSGHSAQEIKAAIVRNEIVPPRLRRAGVPEELEDLVLRMLAASPSARPASGLRDELRAIRGRLATESITPRDGGEIPGRASPPVRTLEVHRFAAPSGDHAVEHFSTGLGEAVQIRLAALPGLRVLDSCAGEEGELTVEGSVHRCGDRIRIHAGLLERHGDRRASGVMVEGHVSELFDLEDRLTRELTSALVQGYGAGPGPGETSRTTRDAVAYDLYLQARGHLHEHQVEDNVERAMELLRRALDRDPAFVRAVAVLAEACWRRYELTRERRWAEEAEATAGAALASSPQLPEVHVTLGLVRLGTGRAEEAASSFRRALDQEERNGTAWRGLARAHESAGRMEEATAAFRRAIELSPDDWAGHNALGGFYFRHGRYEEALAAFRDLLRAAPGHALGWSNLGACFAALGRAEEAIDAYERSLLLRPNKAARANLASLFVWKRDFGKAIAHCEEALKLAPGDYRLWRTLGGACRLCGRLERSAEALVRAIELAREHLEVNPRDALVRGHVASCEALLGRRDEAERHLSRALELGPAEADVLACAVGVLECLGAREGAIGMAVRAVRAGYAADAFREDAFLDDLAADPRFVAAMATAADEGDETGKAVPAG